MTIIGSDKTLICLRNACQFIGNLIHHKGRLLFVNISSLCDEIVEQITKRIGCAGDTSWRIGGFLTNSGSPKKFRSRNKKLHLGSTQPPDCVVIMDTERKSSVILEADKLQIPIVGLVDSSMLWEIYKQLKRFVAAMEATAREEEVATQQLSHTKTETGEESETLKQIKTSSANNENIFVIPYESLALASDDPLETKKLLGKLVVLKLNGGLGTKMGFNGPNFSILSTDVLCP